MSVELSFESQVLLEIQHLKKVYIISGNEGSLYSPHTTTVNALRIQRSLYNKMSASKNHRISGLKSWGKENMIQAIKAVCNKEMGYLAAEKTYNLPHTTLYDYIR